ncbi:hypothetical protein PENANT_c005G06122 [Penicillium antarcticum]|uniref:Uncharacterized protein n=1 Tax=Penicillium antarcticum TaxID=416450 RepID=A0A1V6QF81_9EURO|nr:uncharacterized protein N7508_007770 [Penicillium antarcticum]KAJ5297521.1 hypothetical protein N7508_007770 [Penicillium antarcticum]OQD87672.1 hypothetical protein PENANT_c005G06122 [Penicillium antarcticum]
MSLIRSHSHWPRGIPAFIRRHEEPVAPANFDAASRAWRHFVRDQWVGGNAADQQKQALIERWATADQQFRDSYQSRALEDEPSVARPNFLDMHMALDGTVFFRDCYAKLIIDDRTLETGLGLWVEFSTNGIYTKAYRAQMMMEEFAHFYCEIGPGNQVPIEQALIYIESRVIYQDRDKNVDPREILEDEPVDMRRPLVEIYRGDEVDLVDDYAPGFREAEEQGNGLAIGYDLEQILANDGNPLTITDHGSDH